MESNLTKIQILLNEKAELQARLNLLPYDGTPEIKTISDKKYLYIRKRELNKVKSTYVGEFNATPLIIDRVVKDICVSLYSSGKCVEVPTILKAYKKYLKIC